MPSSKYIMRLYPRSRRRKGISGQTALDNPFIVLTLNSLPYNTRLPENSTQENSTQENSTHENSTQKTQRKKTQNELVHVKNTKLQNRVSETCIHVSETRFSNFVFLTSCH